MTGESRVSHPFGALLREYRRRKPGLSQERLAHRIGYDEAVLVRMSQGKKDLTGPSGRERVLRLIEALHADGALLALEEANGLLAAASQPPLYDGIPLERALIQALRPTVTARPAELHFTLPAPVSSFVGREADVARLTQMLHDARLVTLTGAGGSGKTRLALELGRAQAGRFAHGALFVGLASARHADEVVPAIAQALGVRETAGVTLLDAIKRFLAAKTVLLVLDNFEHVLDSATVVAELLMAAPWVKVIATSREPLRLNGEHVYAVEPLALESAVALFAQRAQAVRTAFELTPDTAPVVADISRRLDRLPLAIELAAARMREFSPQQLLASLAGLRAPSGLDALDDGPRDAPARHRTLRAMIGWSYALLSPAEQRVLRALGVFVGGAEIEHVERIAALGGALSPRANLQALVTKNLARAIEQADGTTRYVLLELIREFALGLPEAVEQHALRRAHAEAFAALVARLGPLLHGRQQREAVMRLRLEKGNFRAALEWSFAQGGDRLLGCLLVGYLRDFWNVEKMIGDAQVRHWATLAMQAVTDDMPFDAQGRVWLAADNFVSYVSGHSRRALALFEASGDRAAALIAKGYVARTLFYEHDYPAAIHLHEEAVAQSRALGDHGALRFNLSMLADGVHYGRQAERAGALYRELLALDLADGDLSDAAETLLYCISGAAKERLQFAEALRCDEEGLELARQLESPNLEAKARLQIAEDHLYLGDVSRAVAMLEDCLAFARDNASGYERVTTPTYLARALLAAGNLERARALLCDALRLAVGMGYYNTYEMFDVLAAVASARGDALRCAKLNGAAERVLAARNHYRRENLTWEFAPYLAKARAVLGDATYAAAQAEGRAMSVEQAVAYALGEGGR
jgi:predicted ATPase